MSFRFLPLPTRCGAPLTSRGRYYYYRRGGDRLIPASAAESSLGSPSPSSPFQDDSSSSSSTDKAIWSSAPPSSASIYATTATSDNNNNENDDDDDVLIEVRDVWKSFGDKPILRGASFKIRRGEAVGIIGSSGTGKSTTLRIMAGLLVPDRGEVLIKGRPRSGLLSDDPESANLLHVGMVFQSAALFDSLTVGHNVGFLLYEHSTLPEAEIQTRVTRSLARVGLTGVEDLYPSALSGGMKKRVALARAIVAEGLDDEETVLMYDEPTAGLDPVASTVVEDLMRNLHVKDEDLEGPAGSTYQPPPPPPPATNREGAGHPADGAKNSPSTHSSSTSSSRLNRSTSTSSEDENGKGGGGGGGGGVGQQLNRKGISSYIVVTHQHSTIRRAVDRLIFLHKGKVVWEGPTEQFDTTDEPIVRQFATGALDGPIKYL